MLICILLGAPVAVPVAFIGAYALGEVRDALRKPPSEFADICDFIGEDTFREYLPQPQLTSSPPTKEYDHWSAGCAGRSASDAFDATDVDVTVRRYFDDDDAEFYASGMCRLMSGADPLKEDPDSRTRDGQACMQRIGDFSTTRFALQEADVIMVQFSLAGDSPASAATLGAALTRDIAAQLRTPDDPTLRQKRPQARPLPTDMCMLIGADTLRRLVPDLRFDTTDRGSQSITSGCESATGTARGRGHLDVVVTRYKPAKPSVPPHAMKRSNRSTVFATR
ncbi:hypothetical protein ABN034_20640 [Actinopolymorpha sp. B11F2]|uniref:hypothetical protein n=1 Tax=Actinopolymorpha sp. B11F2 TaxID=3160862 RepID=UPI0032E4B901